MLFSLVIQFQTNSLTEISIHIAILRGYWKNRKVDMLLGQF